MFELLAPEVNIETCHDTTSENRRVRMSVITRLFMGAPHAHALHGRGGLNRLMALMAGVWL
ncbi:hypothetical protein RHOFW510R12_04015 [Rhodanobacter sp. FW510-R12]